MSKKHHKSESDNNDSKLESKMSDEPKSDNKLESKKSDKKTLCQKGIFILILFLIFSTVFTITFLANKSSAKEKYSEYNQASLAIRNYGMSSAAQIESIFSKYGIFMGIGLGLIAMIISYILYGLFALIKITRFKLTNPILNLSIYSLLMLFGMELAFFENRFTTIGNATIAYVGAPLFYTSIIMMLLSSAAVVRMILKKDVKA